MTHVVGGLAASLERIDPDRTWIEARLGQGEPGWILASDVSTIVGSLPLLDDPAPTDPRSWGASVLMRYTFVATLASQLYVNDRRVPDLDPATIRFRPYTAQRPLGLALGSSRFSCLPDDPDASAPEATAVADLAALRATLVAEIERFVEPVIDPVRLVGHLGSKAQWGIAASTTLLVVVDELAARRPPDDAVAELDALLVPAGPLRRSPPSAEVVDVEGRRRVVTTWGACCLFYRRRVPAGERCDVCPLLTREERVRLQAEAARDRVEDSRDTPDRP